MSIPQLSLVPPQPALVRCSKCRQVLPASDFGPGKKKNGLNSWCRQCHRGVVSQWQKTETGRESKHEYRSTKRSKDSEAQGHKSRLRAPGGWQRRQVQCIRSRAKRLGVPFDLTVDDLTIPTYCPVLGILLLIGDGRHRDASPSVDRIDPARGYVRGNVAVISNRANRIKNDGTTEEHRRLVSWMQIVGAP